MSRRRSRERYSRYVCYHYLRGFCIFGDECRKSHDKRDMTEEELRILERTKKMLAEEEKEANVSKEKERREEKRKRGERERRAEKKDVREKKDMGRKEKQERNEVRVPKVELDFLKKTRNVPQRGDKLEPLTMSLFGDEEVCSSEEEGEGLQITSFFGGKDASDSVNEIKIHEKDSLKSGDSVASQKRRKIEALASKMLNKQDSAIESPNYVREHSKAFTQTGNSVGQNSMDIKNSAKTDSKHASSSSEPSNASPTPSLHKKAVSPLPSPVTSLTSAVSERREHHTDNRQDKEEQREDSKYKREIKGVHIKIDKKQPSTQPQFATPISNPPENRDRVPGDLVSVQNNSKQVPTLQSNPTSAMHAQNPAPVSNLNSVRATVPLSSRQQSSWTETSECRKGGVRKPKEEPYDSLLESALQSIANSSSRTPIERRTTGKERQFSENPKYKARNVFNAFASIFIFSFSFFIFFSFGIFLVLHCKQMKLTF